MIYFLSIMALCSLIFIGMASLNFAMDKPYKQLLTQKPVWLSAQFLQPFYLKIIGCLCLAIALFLSMQIWGFSIGLAAYFGLLTLVVGVLIFLLSYKMTWAIKLMTVSVLVSLFCLAGMK